MNDTQRDILACIINLLWSLGWGIACIIGIIGIIYFLYLSIYNIPDLLYYTNLHRVGLDLWYLEVTTVWIISLNHIGKLC